MTRLSELHPTAEVIGLWIDDQWILGSVRPG